MSAWRLERTPRAEDDLLEIWRHVAQDDPYAADRLLDDFAELFAKTADFPRIGRPVEGVMGYRMLTRASYLLFYRLIEEERRVQLMRVLHGARDWPALFDA